MLVRSTLHFRSYKAINDSAIVEEVDDQNKENKIQSLDLKDELFAFIAGSLSKHLFVIVLCMDREQDLLVIVCWPG